MPAARADGLSDFNQRVHERFVKFRDGKLHKIVFGRIPGKLDRTNRKMVTVKRDAALPSSVEYLIGPRLDQGSRGICVACAVVDAANTAPTPATPFFRRGVCA